MAKIMPANNGPYLVEGDFKIVDTAGNPWDLSGRAKVALCRCGQSANKPFCDGSHARVAFQSEVKAAKLPPPAAKKP